LTRRARADGRDLFAALVYAGLATSVVSSLGMLLVPVVATEMAVPTSAAQWMITGNLLVGAITAPTVGRLAEGARSRLLLQLILFVTFVASVVAALAPNFGVLLAGRIAQGVAYGIVPIGIAVVRERLPREMRALAIATLSITVSIGLGIGYPLAGIAVGALGIAAAFWLAAAFMLSALIVVWATVPRTSEVSARPTSFDFGGAALLSLSLASLVIGLSEGPRLGWTSPMALGLLGGSALFALLWLTTARFATVPFVDVQSIRILPVLVTHVASAALASTIYLAMSTSSLVAQAPPATGYGLALPAFWAGFIILPLSVGSFIASRALGWLMIRFRLFDVLFVGSAVIVAGQLLLFLLHGSIWQLMVGMLVVGAGMGVVFGVAPVLVARSVPLREVNSAASFNQVVRTMGGTLGSAVAGSVFAATLQPDRFPSSLGITVSLIFGLGVAVAVAGLLLVWSLWSARAVRG
jgi:predicted MFS family arabinose efflux permease